MAWWWDDGPGGCRNAGNGEGDHLDTSCPLLDAGRVKSTKCNYMDNPIIYWLWKWTDIRKGHILVDILVSPVMTLRQWDTKSQYQLLYNLSQTRQSPRWQPHHWLAYRPRTPVLLNLRWARHIWPPPCRWLLPAPVSELPPSPSTMTIGDQKVYTRTFCSGEQWSSLHWTHGAGSLWINIEWSCQWNVWKHN